MDQTSRLRWKHVDSGRHDLGSYSSAIPPPVQCQKAFFRTMRSFIKTFSCASKRRHQPPSSSVQSSPLFSRRYIIVEYKVDKNTYKHPLRHRVLHHQNTSMDKMTKRSRLIRLSHDGNQSDANDRFLLRTDLVMMENFCLN